MDLAYASPQEIRALIDDSVDPTIIRALLLLEQATLSGDPWLKLEALSLLSGTMCGATA